MASIDETHNPARRSWVESANGHEDFPIQNLPFGIFTHKHSRKSPGVAIGDRVLDLRAAIQAGLIPETWGPAFRNANLNAFLNTKGSERVELRHTLSELLSNPSKRNAVSRFLYPLKECSLHLPAKIGSYSDFYVGINHATNVGRLFRPENPLLPNYKYVPIGYHGRSTSVRPSDERVIRPTGQTKDPNADIPTFGPTRRLDYELELGIWIGNGNKLGRRIPISEASEHIAGFCLLNDWSARDFQAWEYQPLGPFLSKSFHSTISPWIVTAEALTPFRTDQPARPAGDPRPLEYLWDKNDQRKGAFNIEFSAHISTTRMRDIEGKAPFLLSKVSTLNMYWTVAQIVAHHTSNGCNLESGDILGSGTISGTDRSAFGSLLEVTKGGSDPLTLPNGEIRSFIEDGDEITFSAKAQAKGFVPIGFGLCRATIEPAE